MTREGKQMGDGVSETELEVGLSEYLCASWKDNVSPTQRIRTSDDRCYDGTASWEEALSCKIKTLTMTMTMMTMMMYS